MCTYLVEVLGWLGAGSSFFLGEDFLLDFPFLDAGFNVDFKTPSAVLASTIDQRLVG